MSPLSKRRLLPVFFVAITFGVFLLLNPGFCRRWDLAREAQNSTLGFGQVYYISLPFRTDRQDAIELVGALTDVSLTYQPGVNGSTIVDKAKPEGSIPLGPGYIGCWRSHADTWRRIIKENILTALILEDDADWDVEVHDIFEELSRQMRKGELRSQPSTNYERHVAPYGYDWDVMWVGTCWDTPNEEKRPRHQIYTDINAPNREELTDSFIKEMEGWGAKVTDATRQRIIAPSWDPVCLVGYAVTRKGAQKLLYETSIKGIHVPVDLHMVSLVQDGILNAYTVIPPLINPMIVNDKSDSDINGNAKDESITEHVWERRSENLKKSARAALSKMGSGP